MVMAPATILGGLPVIAEVTFTRGDGWTTDDDASVDALYWRKRDDTPGKPLPESVWDRLERSDTHWECGVIEQVSDHLAYEDYVAEQGPVQALAPFESGA